MDQIQKLKLLIQIQIKPKSRFEFVPQNPEKLVFLDVVGFGGLAFSVETVWGFGIFSGN